MESTDILINILAPCLFLVLSFFVYYLGRNKLSSALFLIGCYTLTVVILFFTYGDYIEKVSTEEQINYIIDSETSNLRVILEVSGFPKDKIDNYLNIKIDPSLDKNTKKNNIDIITQGIIFGSVIFILGFLLSYLLWVKNDKQQYNTMIYYNLIILFFVILVEMIYFSCLAKNYRVINTNEIYYNFYNELYKYSTS